MSASSPLLNSPSNSAAMPTDGPVAVKAYCDRWSSVFRQLAAETKIMSETLLKWMLYDQSASDPRPGGQKWTKEEQELLREALSTYGDDMDKICQAMPTRTEQAIRAAVKRKLDPAFLQRIGPLKKRNKNAGLEDNSPLASYFINHDVEQTETNGEVSGTRHSSIATRQSSPEKATADNQKPGWFYQEAGVELNDHDFLAILEDDPLLLEGGMQFAGIPAAPPIRMPEEAAPLLQEKYSSAQDFIFLQNFKMPLLELAKELNVFKQSATPAPTEMPFIADTGAEETDAPKESLKIESDTVPEPLSAINERPTASITDGEISAPAPVDMVNVVATPALVIVNGEAAADAEHDSIASVEVDAAELKNAVEELENLL